LLFSAFECSGYLRVLECDFGNTSPPSVLMNCTFFKLTTNGRLEIWKSSLGYSEYEWNGFVEISGGILVLEESRFSNIELKSKSLIRMNSGDILIEKCEFSDIELINGNGSVIYSEINNGNVVKIISILFLFSFLFCDFIFVFFLKNYFVFIFCAFFLFFRQHIYKL
jgi:hypothetical protein